MNEQTYCHICSVETDGSNYCYLCYYKRWTSFRQLALGALLLMPPMFMYAQTREEQAEEVRLELDKLHDEYVDIELALLGYPWSHVIITDEYRELCIKRQKELNEIIQKLTREWLELLRKD